MIYHISSLFILLSLDRSSDEALFPRHNLSWIFQEYIVKCLSLLIQNSCGISSQLLSEKLLITSYLESHLGKTNSNKTNLFRDHHNYLRKRFLIQETYSDT